MKLINKTLTFTLLFTLFNSSLLFGKKGKIRILLTAALVDNGFYEFREQQYIRCLEILNSWGYRDQVYIVEAIKKEGPTFLDQYCDHVFYSQANDATLKNNGINEAINTREALKYFNFDDDDMIIKLTGRYEFIDDSFIQLAINNQDNYDVIGRFEKGGIFTLCYAMRCKYLYELLKNIDYKAMKRSKDIIPIEIVFNQYIQKNSNKWRILSIEQLHVKAILTGSTTMTGYDGVTMTF